MRILNEYTKVMYSDGWMFAVVFFAILLAIFFVTMINSWFDGDHEIAAVMLVFVFVCGIVVFASFTMANKVESRYIQCIIEDDYPASELLKYQIVSTEGEIVTLKERESE